MTANAVRLAIACAALASLALWLAARHLYDVPATCRSCRRLIDGSTWRYDGAQCRRCWP